MGKGSKKVEKKKVVMAAAVQKPLTNGKSKSKSSSPSNIADEKTVASGNTGKAKKSTSADSGSSWAGFLTRIVAGDEPVVPKKKKKSPPPPTPPTSSSEEDEEESDEVSTSHDSDQEEEESAEESEEQETGDENEDSDAEESASSSAEALSDVETSRRTKKPIQMNGNKQVKPQSKKDTKALAKQDASKQQEAAALADAAKSKKEKKNKPTEAVANGNHVAKEDESVAIKKEIAVLLEEQAKMAKHAKKLQVKMSALESTVQKWQKEIVGVFQKGFDAATLSANTQIKGLQSSLARLEASISESYLNPVVPSQQDVAVSNFASSSRYGAIGGKSPNDLSHPPGLSQ